MASRHRYACGGSACLSQLSSDSSASAASSSTIAPSPVLASMCRAHARPARVGRAERHHRLARHPDCLVTADPGGIAEQAHRCHAHPGAVSMSARVVGPRLHTFRRVARLPRGAPFGRRRRGPGIQRLRGSAVIPPTPQSARHTPVHGRPGTERGLPTLQEAGLNVDARYTDLLPALHDDYVSCVRDPHGRSPTNGRHLLQCNVRIR